MLKMYFLVRHTSSTLFCLVFWCGTLMYRSSFCVWRKDLLPNYWDGLIKFSWWFSNIQACLAESKVPKANSVILNLFKCKADWTKLNKSSTLAGSMITWMLLTFLLSFLLIWIKMICPDWELNQQAFGLWDDAQPRATLVRA